MRRSRTLVVALSAAALAGATLSAAVTSSASAATPRPAAATTQGHSLVTFHGTRGALPTGSTARASAAAAADPNTPLLDNEIKSPDLGEGAEGPGGGGGDSQITDAPKASSVPAAVDRTGVVAHFQGVNHFQSRYSGGGDQYSGEPPDQGMCVGGNYVFEIVNSVVQVYTKSGTPLITGNQAYPDGPKVGLTLNEFYGLPPTLDRAAGGPPYGPFMFDTSCLYDSSAQRWFATSANLDQDPETGDFTGANQVWIAVSKTSNPLGAWRIWSIDTTNNGKNGSPNHHCPQDACFGDYPQIGMDAHGFYITTNEFEFFGDGFNGAQVYALSKQDLVAGTSKPTMQMFQNVQTKTYADAAYTMQPVNALAADWSKANNGTMYFGMSGSAYSEDLANSIVVYSLSNTASLDGNTPALKLKETSAATQPYATPTYAQQKNGPMPLLQCLNAGASCPVTGADVGYIKPPLVLDAGNSSKVYGAWLHAGKVYLTAGTALKGTGAASYDDADGSWAPINQRTGVAWFILRPGTTSSSAPLSLVSNGYVAVDNANLTYPSIVVGPSGSGGIGATLVGPGYYPSAVVARFAPGHGPRQVQITGPGVGPNDGFTGTALGDYDPRWGDYGAATVTPDGTMWFASEYIAQKCNETQYFADPFGTCGYTRTTLANWSTHITGIKPLY